MLDHLNTALAAIGALAALASSPSTHTAPATATGRTRTTRSGETPWPRACPGWTRARPNTSRCSWWTGSYRTRRQHPAVPGADAPSRSRSPRCRLPRYAAHAGLYEHRRAGHRRAGKQGEHLVLSLTTLVLARTVMGAVKSALWRGRPPPPRPVTVLSAARPAGLAGLTPLRRRVLPPVPTTRLSSHRECVPPPARHRTGLPEQRGLRGLPRRSAVCCHSHRPAYVPPREPAPLVADESRRAGLAPLARPHRMVRPAVPTTGLSSPRESAPTPRHRPSRRAWIGSSRTIEWPAAGADCWPRAHPERPYSKEFP